jgi:hypothetical protein
VKGRAYLAARDMQGAALEASLQGMCFSVSAKRETNADISTEEIQKEEVQGVGLHV